MSALSQPSLDVMRHVQIHGPRSRKQVCDGMEGSSSGKTLDNLCSLGYLSRGPSTEPATYVLTNKGRIRLATPYLKQAVIQPPKPPKPRAKVQPKPEPAVETPVQSSARDRYVPPGTYVPTEYAPCLRPGSMVAFTLPSRIGGRLFYRDGLVTDIAGNPLNA